MHRCPLLLASAAGLFVAAEKWTFGAVQGIFAESRNRVFILERGELPKLDRPPFPNASVGPISSPGNAGDAVHGVQFDPATRKVYVTDRSSHRIEVFDENGKFLDQRRSSSSISTAITSIRGAARVSGPAPCGMCTG